MVTKASLNTVEFLLSSFSVMIAAEVIAACGFFGLYLFDLDLLSAKASQLPTSVDYEAVFFMPKRAAEG